MHLDISTTIWLILVIIGVISSIAGKARKATQRFQPAQVQPAAPAPPAPERWQSYAQEAAPVAPVEPVVVRAPLIVKRATPAPPPVPPPLLTAPLLEAGDGTKGFRGMFERPNLARAFVAAQVFGPPKALQEQSLWSPRHSEPSI